MQLQKTMNDAEKDSDEKRDEILKLKEKTNYDDLTYHYCNSKNKGNKRFTDFDNEFSFFKKIRDGSITLEKAKSNQ